MKGYGIAGTVSALMNDKGYIWACILSNVIKFANNQVIIP
jgi:hypothetical protein